MFGLILAGASSALSELSDSIGKQKVSDGNISLYTFGFLNVFVATVFFIARGFVMNDFSFSVLSLPTFLPRLCLEILQAHLSVMAVVKANRSDFGFMRVLTIPLLFLIDLAVGNTINGNQFLGIAIIAVSLISLLSFEKFKSKGLWLLVILSMNAAITISLYRYDITRFNSVDAEQSIVLSVLCLYFFILATVRAKENPVLFFKSPLFLIQSVASGLSSAVGSFAYLFSSAAVIITAALRAFAVLSAIISGRFYFGEKKFFVKLALCVAVTFGLILLVL